MGQATPNPPEDDVDSTLSSESPSSEDVHQPSVDSSEDNPTQVQPQDTDEKKYEVVHVSEDKNGSETVHESEDENKSDVVHGSEDENISEVGHESEAVHGSEVENESEVVHRYEVVHGSEVEKASKVVQGSEFENGSGVGNGSETVPGSEIENGPAVVQKRSPEEALDEIRSQQTHYLYCPKCKSDITKDAELLVKNEDIRQPFVISIPRVFPFPHFHLLWPLLRGQWMKIKTLVLNYFRRLIPVSIINLRFLFVAILLLLSVIVLWSPYPPPPQPLPEPLPPVFPSQPLPEPLPSAKLPTPPSPWPGPGLIPDLPPSEKLPTPPSSWPELHLYENISWIIHLPTIKYLNLLALVFLSLLALCWPCIFPIINGWIPWINRVPQPDDPVPDPKPAVQTNSVLPTNKPEEVISPAPPKLKEKPTPPTPKETPKEKPTPPTPKETPKEDPAPPRKDWNDSSTKHPAKEDPVKNNTAKDIPAREDPPKKDLEKEDPTTEDPPRNPPIIPIPFISLFKKLIPWEIGMLEIVKSIVYGGLIESITSLGVVSSAAASGASTLNVLALGVANLFSGLFLIIHSLYGLITFQPLSHSANRDQHVTDLEGETLYKDRLGAFRNVKVHCFVVVVSFIFFGVIPPLFYGLSFKRTDKGHYKAAVVLAVSLVCVISLSFGKAWAFKMAKLKTVAQYTGMAVGASAISFITSQIVSDVLEKYGFHELASDYRKV